MRNLIERCRVQYGSLKRLVMWHTCSRRLPIYLVAEYPKAGGTWFSQLLAESLDLPFYRNTEPQKIRSCVMAGHHLYSPRFHNATAVIRDGRDVVVSAYYHFCFKNDKNHQFAIDRNRRHLQFQDYDDIETNLPRFIEFLFEVHCKRRFHFNWTQFLDSWMNQNVPVVRYEDLLTRPVEELLRVTQHLIGTPVSHDKAVKAVEKFNFSKVTGRKQGQENTSSFARKGIAGDWKNHFSLAAREAFHHYAGKHLINAGYEPDSSWVSCGTETRTLPRAC